MSADLVERLEQEIDRTSLKTVIETLALICDGKAEHITVNWQDAVTAKNWDRAARHLDKVAAALSI